MNVSMGRAYIGRGGKLVLWVRDIKMSVKLGTGVFRAAGRPRRMVYIHGGKFLPRYRPVSKWRWNNGRLVRLRLGRIA